MTEVTLPTKEPEQHVKGFQQYVLFSLNDELYAIDTMAVQEIIELTSITKVPHLPDFFKGVINLRGTIIPVVDLKLKFMMASDGYKKHTCIIVTEFSGGVMGLIVDAVSDVLHLPEESVAAPPSFGPKIDTAFIKGMGKAEGKLTLILDIDKVLSQDEKSLVARVAGGASIEEEPA